MKADGSTLEKSREQIRKRRNTYTFLVIVWVLFPIVGYISETGWTFPQEEALRFLPLNYGAYGLAGMLVVYLFIALAVALIAFVETVRSWRSLLGIILGIIAFAVILGLATGIMEVFFSNYGTQLAHWLSENISKRSIPGISGTLGIAVFCSFLYDIPFFVFIWRCVINWKHCVTKGVPVAQEKGRELTQARNNQIDFAENRKKEKSL